MPGINLGDEFPNFEAETTQGKIKFHDWAGDGWAILFSHPRDYTPVCTTELASVAKLVPEFTKRNCKLIALSCDTVSEHCGWLKDLEDYAGGKVGFPIIADQDRVLAKKLGMIDPDETTETGMPLTCRAVFVVGPDKKMKLSLLYPATTGRNFSEVLRVLDSLQLTMYEKVATPAGWKNGDECMILPSVKPEEVPKLFPEARIRKMPSGKQYMRFTPQPKSTK